MDIPVRTAVFCCFGLILALTPFVTLKTAESLKGFPSPAYIS